MFWPFLEEEELALNDDEEELGKEDIMFFEEALDELED